MAKTANRVDVLTADEFRAVVNSIPNSPARTLLGTSNTNWQDEIYSKATGTDHNLSVAGGIGIVPYHVRSDKRKRTDCCALMNSAAILQPST